MGYSELVQRLFEKNDIFSCWPPTPTDLLGALDFDTTISLSCLLSKEFGADCELDFNNEKLWCSPSELDDGMLSFVLMKVTISHWLNSSLVSKIPSTRCVWADGLAIEIVFDNKNLIKSCCGFISYVCFDLTINWKMDGILFESADACISAVAFDAAFADWVWVKAMFPTCVEELFAMTWWEWTQPFNAALVTQKDKKRTRYACFELCFTLLRTVVEWE